MEAFHLPVTLSTVMLVMAAQGGGRIIPLAPASAGLRLAMLSYGFVETTGHAVDIAAITTFTFGVGALTMVAGLIVGLDRARRRAGDVVAARRHPRGPRRRPRATRAARSRARRRRDEG